LSEREYQALHRSLIEACRSLAGAADGETRAFYERLESIAQPWMALYVLERAERDVLFDLLQSSQPVERGLGCRPWRFQARDWAVSGLAAAAAVACVALLGWAGRELWALLWQRLQDGTRSLRQGLMQVSATAWWFLGLLVALAALVWVAIRAPRS